jgi:DHA2 family multidrug resistance protein-like MFS transporter
MTATATTPTPTSAPVRAGRREWLGLGVLALACLVYVMDLTVLHLAVPAISEDLRPTSAQLLWIIDIYGFMVAGFLVTMGTLGDRIGRRRLLLIGAAAFGAISVLAAFSTSAEMLIVNRALLGIAGATLAPSTLSLIFSMFQDPGQRTRAIAVWISAFSVGSALGPVVGGVLLEHFAWGSVFLISVPVMALLLVLGPIILPEYRDPDAGRLDLASAALSLVAILSVIFGLKQVAQDGLGPEPFVAITVGLVAGAMFIRRQRRLTDPMIDLALFRIPTFRAALSINFLAIFMSIGYFLFVAQYLQLVLGLSPLEAGLWSVPSAIAFTIGSNAAPRLLRYIRPSHLMAGGLIVAAVGLAMLTQVDRAEGLAVVVLASVVISLGLAPVFGLTTELVVGSAPPERAGAASGISETGAELGGALGISLLGSIGIAIYRRSVSDDLPSAIPNQMVDVARDTLGGAVSVAAQLPGQLGTAVLDVAQTAFVDGMQVVAIISTILAIGVAVVALTQLRDVPPPSGAETADHVPADQPTPSLTPASAPDA